MAGSLCITAVCVDCGGRARKTASYNALVGTLFEPCWLQVYEVLNREPAAYAPLDAAQLVKHYLGLRNTYPDHEVRLVYIFWEPLEADKFDLFGAHRSAVSRLHKATASSAIPFSSLSYLELIAQWEESGSSTWVVDHARRLRDRYGVALEGA